MISVRNHQRLLNGNKLLGLLAIPLLLISCGAFKKTAPIAWPEDDVIVVNPDKDDEPKKDDDPIKDDKDDKQEEELVYSMVTFKGEQFRVPVSKSNSFEIAILLPFHTDNTNSSTDRRRADLMLEYYQGIRVAIPEIEKLDSKFNLRFYDTDNDTIKLKNILKEPEMEYMDLINYRPFK